MKNKKVRELLDSFNEISGIEIFLANKNSRPIYFRHKRVPSVCELVHSLPGGIDICLSSDKTRIAALTSGGEGSVYTCPYGLSELLIPIGGEGAPSGFIFCSMGMCSDDLSDDELIANVMRLLPDVSEDAVRRSVETTKHMTRTEIASYERILRLIADAIDKDELIEEENENLASLTKSYIRSNITGHITLADIAYHLHCSTVSVTQHFKARYGMTVMQYVTEKRLSIAEKLLVETNHPIKKIALQSGFDEAEYFSRLFRRRYGVTPSEYREKAKREALALQNS